MIRIVIADDQASIRLGLEAQFKSCPDIEVVGTAQDGLQAIDQVEKLRPDVLLLDLIMPVLDGLGAAEEINARFPETKILVLTSKNSLLPALQVGVHGYLLKGTLQEDIENAIRSICKGHFQIGPGITVEPLKSDLIDPPPAEEPSAIGTIVVAPADKESAPAAPGSNALVLAPGGRLAKSGPTALAQFDRPVLLQQSPLWSRVIIWGLVGSTAAIVAWASFFKFEEAIPATGQLEPAGAVKEVQAPVTGVVKAILVKEGQRVKKGDVLLRLDPKGTQSELAALEQVRRSLLEENAFYRQQTADETGRIGLTPSAPVPSRMIALAQNRQALLEENQLYRSQVRGSSRGTSLSPEQQLRLQSNLREETTRASAARLETEQLQKQLAQTKIQQESARKTLAVNEELLQTILPVVASGGLAKIEQIKQEEALQKSKAEVERLEQEEKRLALTIAQANEKLDNTVSVSRKDVLGTLSMNEKQIAQIDSQFAKTIVENEKQIAEIDNKLNQAKLTLNYQAIQSPTDGIVFDLKPKAPGFVTNPSEPVLKIVPSDNLVAKVYITNRDIGFVRPGMPVDVRVDSFPFSEFGDIKGTLVSIGSDALPPTQVRNFYSFPAKVKLNSQNLKVQKRKLSLQSGMSLSVNIKTRERTVMSIFTDLFTGEMEGLKHLR
ncbi:HlyD family efflux transporter periplasmic adaptor subunit [Altericista sp. CCNU0014]|uniref:HlyD family efflux transporter periplasmic adaptor subunit n=1 Tax=Altericista sp. CCNU0014 TaxID=3082949 RepID=UPI0038504509